MIIIRIVSHCQGQLKLASLSKDEMHSNLNIAQGFKHRWAQIHTKPNKKAGWHLDTDRNICEVCCLHAIQMYSYCKDSQSDA